MKKTVTTDLYLEPDSIMFTVLGEQELRQDDDWWWIYERSFPADEREPAEVILKSLDGYGGLVFAARTEGRTIGIASVQLLEHTSYVFLVYLAIDPHFRQQKIGSRFLQFIWSTSAAAMQEKGQEAMGMVWEVEKAEICVLPEEKVKRNQRIAFFQKNGGILLPYYYIQPPVDSTTFVEMDLMVRLPDKDDDASSIPGKHTLINSIYFEKYGNVNNIDRNLLAQLLEKVMSSI